MTDRQLLELVVEKVTGIETEIRFMKTELSDVKTDVSTLKTDVSTMKTKQDAIMEQTAGLLEFRAQMQADILEIKEYQKSLAHIVGEHEIYIRNLQRKIV